MSLFTIGQLLGLGFACGLNLYATVAALGLLSRFGVIGELPHGLQGLEGVIVITSALTLYVIEAIVDKVPHVDSLWDTVHTFIRPPAAALLAVGALWTAPLEHRITGAALALLIALAAHGTKAGLRLSLNATHDQRGRLRISVAEDVAAIAFAVAALQYPGTALLAGAVALALIAIFGPRLWRAFTLGLRCLAAWLRGFFTRSRWRETSELPRDIRKILGDTPMAAAPPRGIRAGVDGVPGVAAYRNGWLVVSGAGPVFYYRTMLGSRSAPLPAIDHLEVERGVWADLVRVSGGADYTLYLLKDGPELDAAVNDITAFAPRPGGTA